MKELEYIRREIRDNGYLSTLQIVLKLAQRHPKINRNKVDYILAKISCDDIHKIQYTNSYVSSLKMKNLYIYNPNVKKATRKRSETKKRRAKSS